MSKSKKILVVDDMSMVRKTIRKELEDGGYEVIEAKDGFEALILSAVTSPPDLITLDIEMPKQNGFQTCQKLREEHYTRFFKHSKDGRIPIIFVTGNDNIEDRKKGFELGAADFITKPFAKGEILTAVNKILKPISLSHELTALVVDDSSVARHIVSEVLKGEGLKVIEAEDGVLALEIMETRKHKIDIVITDLEMPRMDGSELVKKIRNEMDMPDLPIIFLTATTDQSDLLRVFKAGATDYLLKPFAKEELLARITVHLERNRLNKHLREMVKELTGLNRMKDNLLAVCSHDLRSPLNGILGFVDLLLEKDNLEAEDTESLHQIRISGNVLMDLINDILDLSKAQAKEVELKLTPVLLSPIAQSSFNSMKHMGENKQQQFELIDNCPNGVILANSSGLGRVFNNLLSNAIKFTPENGQIKVTMEPGPADSIVAMVTDTGIGIPEDKIPYLFDQFTKTSQSGTGGEGGTGLGMSIVKEILEKHDAKIDVSSEDGKGTCFTLTFSQVDEIPVNMPPAETDTSAGVEHPEQSGQEETRTFNILLAVDNPINQKLAKALLNKIGHRVEVANNGNEVVEKYTASPDNFDLIFMDVHMPEMDGYEATKAIRNWDSAIRIPIVAMTAGIMEDYREKCLEAGMDDYLSKPIKPQELSDMLEKWIAKQNSFQPEEATGSDIEPVQDIFDKAGFLDRLMGDEELANEILGEFLEDVPRKFTALKEALDNGDAPLVQLHAHTLKGTSANVGAVALQEMAHHIEVAGKAGDIAKASSLAAQLDKQFEVLKKLAQPNF